VTLGSRDTAANVMLLELEFQIEENTKPKNSIYRIEIPPFDPLRKIAKTHIDN
jgi:hypothetical protein